MSDLRYDPIFGQWAVIAEKRNSRPVEFQQFSQRRAGIDCPFCVGNESVTPQPLEVWSADGPLSESIPNWLVRVLPNKFPALDTNLEVLGDASADNAENSASQDPGQQGIDSRSTHQEQASIIPYQEVLVLSPRHVVSLSGLNDVELSTSFEVMQARFNFHRSRSEIAHVCLFMNCRPLAGASIEHSHFQIIAAPICTQQVRDRVARMQQPVPGSDESRWQRNLAWEIEQGERVIFENQRFVVFCPFASRYSNQIRIAPKQQAPFAHLDKTSRDDLAFLCRKWIGGIERCLDDPAYNLVFHLPPNADSNAAWFVDLIPRFPQSAGFELATECWVNPVAPETAARQFRDFASSHQTT